LTDTISSTKTHSPTQTQLSTQTPTYTPTFFSSPTITETQGPLPSPTTIVARPEGTVLLQASCRYGPGAAYLFEWGLYPGDFVRIINRNEDGSWVYIKPITYNNECWVKTKFLETKGNIDSLEEYYSPLPQGYLYRPVHYVVATRKGDDDRGYLIEAWVCLDGKFLFMPTNYFPYTKTFAIIRDEPGCAQESHARIFTVEKHGYMPWISIPWPPFPDLMDK
jgi:hypothetical protein